VSEVLVIGGGLAGSAAAISLARAGRDVTLIERESAPSHKVCGEFLSVEAIGSLTALGIAPETLGAVSLSRVRLAGAGAVPLPFAAMSLTRRRLDEELLRLAQNAGVQLIRGCRVRTLDRVGDSWSATLETGSTIQATTAFLATGKHDMLARARPRGKQSNLVAFKMYWELSPQQSAALAGSVELMLYRGGYAGLQPVEDGAANLCCLIERAALQRLGGRWDNLLSAMQADSPLLRQRLQAAQPLLAKPLALSHIPYGYVRPSTGGLWILGDQAAVIPSFTGDGMSIALHSGRLASSMFLRGETAQHYQHRLHQELTPQVRLATAISRALLWQPSRAAMVAAVKIWPSLLRTVAQRTRIGSPATKALAQSQSIL
jgi:flavin-dependent dehydrogenase